VIAKNAMHARNKRTPWLHFRQIANRSGRVASGIVGHVLMCCAHSLKEVRNEYHMRRATALNGALSSALVEIFIQSHKKTLPMTIPAALSRAMLPYSGAHAFIISASVMSEAKEAIC
jgi:hypothetical protein